MLKLSLPFAIAVSEVVRTIEILYLFIVNFAVARRGLKEILRDEIGGCNRTVIVVIVVETY